MKNRQLINLLESVLGNAKHSGNESTFNCPYCNHHKKKLVINVASEKWHCWVCGVKGIGVERIFKKLQAYDKIALLKKISKIKVFSNKEDVVTHVSLPSQFIPIVDGTKTSPEFRNAASYLKRRGLNKIDVLRHNIGYCESGPYSGMVIIPSYDSEGILNYFVGRSYYDSTFKHKNPKVSKDIIGFELLINWKEDVNICEGVFDAMTIGENTIPIFGKFLPKKLKLKLKEKSVGRVNIVLDNDARKEALALSESLMSEGIDVRMIDIPNDTDPNEMGKEKINELINKTETLDFRKIVEMKFGL
jgi:DNA primase